MERRSTAKDVAALLGVKVTTVQLYSRDGRIPFSLTPGGHRRYNLEEVRTALDAEEPRPLIRPMPRLGVGPGAEVQYSVMARMDTQRRSIVRDSDELDGILDEAEPPAIEKLFRRPRRVLTAQ